MCVVSVEILLYCYLRETAVDVQCCNNGALSAVTVCLVSEQILLYCYLVETAVDVQCCNNGALSAVTVCCISGDLVVLLPGRNSCR